ncbi:TIGR03086 family metal-binding protein [Streptomyces caeni]|uniref:TIGR03086 family metal-binding protein n=1 Tax=Streptomyces caeni TaxID=2307231 RepID=A0ABW4IZ50_9ACTN
MRTLLSHLVGGTRRIAVVGAGGDGLAPRPFADGIADDGWAAAPQEAGAEVRRARADDARLDAPVRMPWPWGETPGRNVLSGYAMETTAHTWDLREPLGHPLGLGPEPAESAPAVAHIVPPKERRDDDAPFHPARPAPKKPTPTVGRRRGRAAGPWPPVTARAHPTAPRIRPGEPGHR